MNRKIVLAAILPGSFFLVFLGMRIDTNGNSCSKPRPRAIIITVKNVEKAFQHTCSKDKHVANVCYWSNVGFATSCPDQFFPADVLPFSLSTTILSTRAPPLFFSRIC